MKLSDFDYNLPRELIAQYPSPRRDCSKLLVLHRGTGKIEHRIFKDIVGYFQEGDLLVLNNTKVVPARLVGRKETGGKIEALVLYAQGSSLDFARDRRLKVQGREYEVLLKPIKGCKVGSKLIFGNMELKAEVSKIESGRRFLRFEYNGDFYNLLDRLGKMPLPPYIKRNTVDFDRERYQTVYADKKGAIAAPTAGLHFTEDLLSCISQKRVDIDYVTLHVGYGTFRRVKCKDITKHQMEKEYFEIDKSVIEKSKNKKGRTIAVGTTTCRVMETVCHCEEPSTLSSRQARRIKCWATKQSDEVLLSKARNLRDCFPPLIRFASQKRIKTVGVAMTNAEYHGWTDLFIYPPYKFKTVDALLTNFHLPRTTLLMLVSAFCGREMLLKAYQEAVEKEYRFYSYGDAMLIL